MPAARVSAVGHCHAAWGGSQVVRKGQLAAWLDGHCAILADGPTVAMALGGESLGHPD